MTLGPGRWSLDIKKSEGSRVALTGIRRTSEVASFCHIVGLAYDPKSWLPESKKRKAEAPVEIRRA
ncbi:hypothetical protein FQV26_05450 [Planococcus sp. CPCC 101016]|uniref:hypothetical protein n=1 Tax=Planococcus sp. CPCC 101016 TaxID=2599617 RepID=UPI0011B3F3F1|nr:hypothetical protein [Planococcus sp. CPCC 101016]TWT07258.1 hypothetical protein FQV26_05450 [Planococcus sp. CPCC 101016]